MIVPCPSCGASLRNDAGAAGRNVICPKCSGQFQMPALVVTPPGMRAAPVFLQDAFEADSIEHAMTMIVTPEPGISSQERWRKETVYLVEDIGRFLALDQDSCVLDYGCGIGRIAKPLIEKYGCRVVGIDTSRSMRQFAKEYVASERFVAWSPEELDQRIDAGFQVDYALCLWVIQHAANAAALIDRIRRALRPAGLLYVVNQLIRCVPTDQGWCNDGIDVRAELRKIFTEENIHQLPPEAITAELAHLTRVQVLRNQTVAP